MSQNQKKPGDTLLGFGAALVIIGVIFFFVAGSTGALGSPASWAALIVGLALFGVGLLQRRTATERR
jgi:hypothetical protein